jgi:hypothetical protein
LSSKCYSRGHRLGDKKSLERQIDEVTGIPVKAFQGGDLSQFSTADRMSLAESRKTTRQVDKVYYLLGIFDIYVALYGEGVEHAMERHEKKINKRSSSAFQQSMQDKNTAISSTESSSKLLEFVVFPGL